MYAKEALVKETTEVFICSSSAFTLVMDAFSSVTSLSRLMKEAFITDTTDAFSCSRRVVTLVKDAFTMEFVSVIEAFSPDTLLSRLLTDVFSTETLLSTLVKEAFITDTTVSKDAFTAEAFERTDAFRRSRPVVVLIKEAFS